MNLLQYGTKRVKIMWHILYVPYVLYDTCFILYRVIRPNPNNCTRPDRDLAREVPAHNRRRRRGPMVHHRVTTPRARGLESEAGDGPRAASVHVSTNERDGPFCARRSRAFLALAARWRKTRAQTHSTRPRSRTAVTVNNRVHAYNCCVCRSSQPTDNQWW